MATNVDTHISNGKLYNALMTADESEVIDLCRILPDRALHKLTIHDDTVLHLAIRFRQYALAIKLLTSLPEYLLHKLNWENQTGNTILHEAATTDEVSIAKTALQKAPQLLGGKNHLGETALFQAARHGSSEMFDFLADKASENNKADLQIFLERTDGTTVLHISILYHHFGLALKIAKMYQNLIDVPDNYGMTSLQLLSCNPSAFDRGSEAALPEQPINSDQKAEGRYKPALELAKILIERDTSWAVTKPLIDQSNPMPHNYGVNPKPSSNEKGSVEEPLIVKREGEGLETSNGTSIVKIAETPLFLATKSGCVEIVKEILNIYPQAVEHVNDQGQNILHVAIKYRQLDIFQLVEKMEAPMSRLVKMVDNQGNSILHMVGMEKMDFYEVKRVQGPESEFLFDMPSDIGESPTTNLHNELHWFQLVKNVTPTNLINHRNHNRETARGLFAETNRNLRDSAKKWLKDVSDGCCIVAVLIASVTFAAVYQPPGGQDKVATLLSHNDFLSFLVFDVASLIFALAALIVFLLISSSAFRLKVLCRLLGLGIYYLYWSLAMMIAGFFYTVDLMVRENKKKRMDIGVGTLILVANAVIFQFLITLGVIPSFFSPNLKKKVHWLFWTPTPRKSPSTNTMSSTRPRPATRQTSRSPV